MWCQNVMITNHLFVNHLFIAIYDCMLYLNNNWYFSRALFAWYGSNQPIYTDEMTKLLDFIAISD